MVKAEAGQRIFRFMLIITGVANQKEVLDYLAFQSFVELCVESFLTDRN